MSETSSNFAGCYHRRQQGYNLTRSDRRYVHSKFCVVETIRLQGSSYFTCCDFTPCTNSLIVGLHNGKVKVFKKENRYEYTRNCHGTIINNVKCSKDGTLLLTSTSHARPLSRIWNIQENQFTMKLAFNEEEHLEFSKLNEDKVLGTRAKMAIVYDVQTGRPIAAFKHMSAPNLVHPTRNRATFSPSDDLILSSGILWDVRSGSIIHQFNVSYTALSCVFHPNGLEIVLNDTVWDMRKFHLLRTVPELNRSIPTFSPQNVIYARESIHLSGTTCDAFKTLDSYDYSSIQTVDVARKFYDLSVNKYGSQIALVQGVQTSILECKSAVRIYSVGRQRLDEDVDNDMTRDAQIGYAYQEYDNYPIDTSTSEDGDYDDDDSDSDDLDGDNYDDDDYNIDDLDDDDYDSDDDDDDDSDSDDTDDDDYNYDEYDSDSN